MSTNKEADLEAGSINHPKEIDHAGHGTINGNRDGSVFLPAFGGEFQPGLYKPSFRKFANPAPLGLCAFASTTFILSLVNANARGVTVPNVVVGSAYAYGGLIQLLAGMWEMAVGNTFGATALSSYGGFWIAYGIIETNGFGVVAAYEGDAKELNNALGFFLIAWFIFTFMLWLCTLKSTLAFSAIFFFLWITFLLLAIAHLNSEASNHLAIQKAGGIFGIITAFIAWWNGLAGLAERTNSFFVVPVLHFPWSDKVKQEKLEKSNSHTD